MKNVITLFLILSTSLLKAQSDSFFRVDSILVPEIENCGFGEIIAGVDFDNDNLVEIYVVNNMNDIGGNELIPRIYKYENDGTSWNLVWNERSRDIVQQNSWAPIVYGDIDKDNKQEIYWSPANNFTVGNENPPRILVWEANGNDKMGKLDFGFERPSAKWTITDNDNFEVRPFRLIIYDIDNDGNDELIFADRQDNYRFGVVSVSNIPDNGNGSEVWSLKASGLDATLNANSIYDMAIIGNNIYLIHSDGSITPIKFTNGSYEILNTLPNVVPGGSWKSANVVDLDNDGTEEIVIGGWQITSERTNNKVFLLQEEEQQILKASIIANFEPLIGKDGRINGGHDAFGDIDNDGNLDFIFGSRGTTPSVAILRMEYLGGDISDSNNYQISIVDSLYPTLNPGRYDIVSLANLDADPELEILYTNGSTCERFPIVILDIVKPLSVKDNNVPKNFVLEQNYPNPFNPTTNISFSIPFRSNVSLRIFNSLGQLILTLIDNDTFDPGSYNYKFNGQGLSSGIYMYTIETDFGNLSKRMILIK